MDKLREAAQQALEHVQEFKRRWWQVPAFGNKVNKATREAITNAHSPIFESEHALRAALAEQPAEQEPVAWMHTNAVGHTYFRKHAQGTAFKPVPLYTAPQPAKPAEQEPVAWTPREIELIDGMIEVQLNHAERCAHIANRTMAEKQKGWDMERVALLRKIRDTAPQPRRRLSDAEIEEINVSLNGRRDLARMFARAIEKAVWGDKA